MHRNIRETQTADANASRAGTGVQELDLQGESTPAQHV
jgi:hypothetical protein